MMQGHFYPIFQSHFTTILTALSAITDTKIAQLHIISMWRHEHKIENNTDALKYAKKESKKWQ